MPVIPTIDAPQVAPQGGGSYVQASPDPMAFGAGTARATEGLGQTLDKTGDVLAQHAVRFQEQQNDMWARDAIVGGMTKMQDASNEYHSKEGLAAVSGYKGFQTQLVDLHKALVDSAPNPSAKKMVADQAQFMMSRLLGSASSYAASQNKVAQTTSNVAMIQTSGQWAINNQNDPQQINLAATNVRDSAQKLGELKGLDEKGIEALTAHELGKFYTPLIHSIAAQNPSRAAALFEQVRSRMDAPSQAALDGHLKGVNIDMHGQNIASNIFTGGGGGGPGWQGRIGSRIPGVESGGKQFNADGSTVTSVAGAQGKWQVMPDTGPDAARMAGLPWDPERLKKDENYNATLGNAYWNNLSEQYKNPVLATMAYHAGPKNVNTWIASIGDPRTGAISPEEFTRQVALVAPKTAAYARKLGALDGTENAGAPPTNRSEMMAQALSATQGNPLLQQATLRNLNHMMQVQEMDRVDAQRSAIIAAQASKATSDAAETKIIELATGPNPESVTAAQIGDTKGPYAGLTAEAKIKMIGFLDRMTKPATDSAVSHAVAQQLIIDMRRPDGDPMKITSMNQIYDKFGPDGLSIAGFKFVQDQFKDLQTDAGQRLSKVQTDFFAGVKPMVDKSNPLMGKIDWSGSSQFYRFQQDVAAKVAEYRKSGKDPYSLFNTASPDFMGKPEAMTPYMTTTSESIENFSARMRSESEAARNKAASKPADAADQTIWSRIFGNTTPTPAKRPPLSDILGK